MRNFTLNTKYIKNNKILFVFIIIFVLILGFILYNNHNNTTKQFIKTLIKNNTNINIIEDGNPINSYDIIVNNDDFYDKVMSKGELGLGESYMDGDWDSNNLEETLHELMINMDKLEKHISNNSFGVLILQTKSQIVKLLPNNTLKSSPKNISSHYDIGNDLYEIMLDKNMQYTCAYFNKPNMTLDQAQEAKLELIAKKLDFKPGMTVADLGCGFGSTAVYFAKNYGVNVIGATLSQEQVNYYNDNIKHPNVEIRFQDYRNVTGKFDRVYSIGMLEHLGQKNHKEYYDKCYELLNDDGLMLIHCIGTTDRHVERCEWINKYIFPEGEIPHISNYTREFSDKWYLQDYQNFGLSYAKTLRAWKENIGNWEGLDNYDERFRRMWDFYLLGCAARFQTRQIYLNQLVYFKNTTTRPDDAYYIRDCNTINNNY